MQSLMVSSTQQDLAACVAACAPDSCCMAQYDTSSKACKTVTLPPAASDASAGMQVVYKLPPSTLGSASSIDSSIKAKMITNGYYAHCSIQAGNEAAWHAAGFNLDRPRHAPLCSEGPCGWLPVTGLPPSRPATTAMCAGALFLTPPRVAVARRATSRESLLVWTPWPHAPSLHCHAA